MRFVVTSDTHTLHARVDVHAGDVLIHAGDFTGHGTIAQIAEFNHWLGTLPHKHKLVIAGNHDFLFESDPALAKGLLTNCTYLRDEEVHLGGRYIDLGRGERVEGGVRIWASPWQPRFYDWAFNLDRGAQIKAKWDLIPAGIDILVTHGPPFGHGDLTDRGEHVGCADLLDAIRRVKPRYHLFGHIHEGYGITQEGRTTCINAASLGRRKGAGSVERPINPPLVFDL